MNGAHRYGLDDLYAFGLVVESRGLRSAARRHAPSRPSLARSIERLEAAAGGPLLERESAGFVLTPLGERLAEDGERAVRLARETARVLRDGAAEGDRCLRVGVDGPGATVLAASALAELSLDGPVLRARLLRVDADPSRERLDVLLTTGRPPSGPGIDVSVVASDRLAVYASARTAASVDIDDPITVEALPRVVSDETGSVWSLAGPDGRTLELDGPPAVRVEDPSVALGIVAAGTGIALLSGVHLDRVGRGGALVRLLPAFDGPLFTVLAGVPHGRGDLPEVRAFLAAVQTLPDPSGSAHE